MQSDLETKIQYIKGVGPKLAEKFHKLGIETTKDLIFHWPRRYEDYATITQIKDLGNGIFSGQFLISNQISDSDVPTIKGRILGIANKLTSRQHMKITEAVVEDGTGTIKLVWFNQPFLKKILPAGSEWIFRGRVDHSPFTNEWVMEAPTRMKKPCIAPVYPTTAGLSSSYIARIIEGLLDSKIPPKDILKDFLPQDVMKKYELLPLKEAIIQIHTPINLEQVETARKRLAFDELFLISLRARLLKEELKREQAPVIKIDDAAIESFIGNLPFELTSDQKKAAQDIIDDLARGRPMNRLLNGDVGSGKTVVAAVAAYAATKAGFKVALMVPTEVLAMQHFETFLKLFSSYDITVGLLTSNIKKITDNQVTSNKQAPNSNNQKIKPGEAQILIGTHALLQRSIELEKAGLIIVDEQHRFGVKQRALLKEKTNGKLKPHFLSMTATPIPRTLHLALFGDLNVSVINEKPQNRKEIKTRFVEPENRMKAYDFIRTHIKAGQQVFVVCPLIEELEDGEQRTACGLFDQDKKSVIKEYKKLSKEIFPEFKAAMLHGKMKSKEKEAVLSDFCHKKYDILVSTSVIEVGIDIPNASVMMIEDAERFGLAQIHQFRGRVGRAEHQSFCLLFSGSQSQNSLVRLRSLENISDGFKLAEIDLEMRGPGDVFGTMQSGQLELKMASISDRILIEQASRAASEIVQEDPHLENYLSIKEKLAEFEASKHME